MWRRGALLVVLLAATGARGQEPPALTQALALQKSIQQVINQAEPGIACILVSRSELYRKLGRKPAAEVPGQLGSFNPAILLGLDKEEQNRLRRLLDLADPQHVPEAFGSGVVLDPKGLILTNYHVVQDATKVYVRLPGGRASYADIHAADPRSDLAVLRLQISGPALTAIALPKAATIERGQFVVALANPYAAGFRDGQPSASWGIVSNVRRRAPGIIREEETRHKSLQALGTLIQTDVRLNLGCSGGALLNLQGELIGLTTALAAIQGTDNPGGFAIPIDAAFRRIVEVLLRGEEVEYGFLGIRFLLTRTGGAGVRDVVFGSPAELAGVRGHDLIVAVNGQPLADADDASLALSTQLAGGKVKLEIRRQGRLVVAEATLAKLHVPGKKIASSLGRRPYVRGLRVDHASLLVQEPHSLDRIPAGVMIAEVQAGSAAAAAQLKPGEIIMQVNQQPVPTPAAFYQAIAQTTGAWELLLYPGSAGEPGVKVTVK
jgi:S1-C subfamily serine protease